MATVKYLYRSSQDKAPLTLRLFFANEGKKIRLSQKIETSVTKEFYYGDLKAKRINDIVRANYAKEIKQKLEDLEFYILDAFYKEDPATISKGWLKSKVESFYNPPEEENKAPKHLTDFFLFYIDIKGNDLTAHRIRRIKTVRNKLLRFEEAQSKKILVADVNDIFKKSFIDYGESEQYSRNALKADLSVIKTVCRYAKQWGLKTSPQLANLSIKAVPVKSPYLNFEELEAIQNADFPKGGYLDNARDWLIISCFTGQRVSDFLRFTPEMVIKDRGKFFLSFTQKKTNKLITIPFLKEAKAIFDKHGGNFPRPISSVKYNKYIKEVCKECEINKPTKGKVQICIAEDPEKATRNDYRRALKTVPKHKLVSSHIGRRSFATNFYGKVPTSYLIKVTGHKTEKMFLKYIQKTDKETAFEAFKYFE